MTVIEMIEKLNGMPEDKSILCQVVAENGDCWNCGFDIEDIESSWMVHIRVSHPQIKRLPDPS